MRIWAFVCYLFFILITSSCGKPTNNKLTALQVEGSNNSPWGSISALLVSSLTDDFRVLKFSDGVTISAKFNSRGDSALDQVCQSRGEGSDEARVCFNVSSLSVVRCYRGGSLDHDNDCNAVYSLLFEDEDDDCDGRSLSDRKILACSDDFSVLVYEDDRTLCRVHTPSDTGRCLEVDSGDLSGVGEENIRWYHGAVWAGYDEEELAYDLSATSGSIDDAPEDYTASYFAADDSPCTVNAQGLVTAGGSPGSCVITLQVSADGFITRTFQDTIQIAEGQSTSWAGYDEESVGLGLTLSPSPLVDPPPGANQNFSSSDEFVCSVDSLGVVTGSAIGRCSISLAVTAADFVDKTFTDSILVLLAMGNITWPNNAYPSGDLIALNTRDISNPPSIASPLGATLAYSSTTPTICRVNASSGAVTGLSAGTCVVKATFSRESYAPKWADHSGITITVRSMSLSWANGYGIGASLTVGSSALSIVNEPVKGQSAAVLSYTSSDTDICTVSENGAVTAVSAGTCTITAQASLAGYAPATASSSLTILNGVMGTISWDNAYTTGDLAVPGTRSLANAPTIDSPSGTTISYSSTTASVCSVDSSSGRVTAISAGSCVIRATFSKTGYASKTADSSAVTVVAGVMGVAVWNNAYASGDLAVPGTRALLNAPTLASPVDPTILYSSTTLSVCTVDSGTGMVTAVTAGSCVIRATFSKTGYASKTVDAGAMVTVNGTMGVISWTNAYTSGDLAVPNTRTLSNAPTIDSPSGTTISYSSTTASICTVDSSDGEITAVSAGSCVIRVTFSKAGYTSKTADATAVTVVGGTMGTITWSNAYASGDLAVPNTRVLSSTPTIDSPSGTTISYSSTTASICTVDSSDGEVTAISAGSCVIRVTFSKAGYTSKTADATAVTVVDGTMGTITWANAYASGDLAVPNTRVLATAPTIDSPSGTTVTYSSTTASICTVNSSSGTITALSAGSCVIRATFSKTGYTSKTADASTVTVVAGAMGNISWANAYAVGDLTVPGTRTLSNTPTIAAPLGTTVTYSSTTLSICTVDSSLGTITAASAGSCVIRATFSKTGYTSKTADANAVTVLNGTMGAITWNNAYASGDLSISATRSLSNAPTIDSPSGTTISYSSTTASICSVDSGTGTITGIASGSCVIRATFSKTGYDSKTADANAVMVVGSAMGTISWTNAYAVGNLTVPNTRVLSNAPTIDSPSDPTISYSSTTASICSVDSGTGTITAVSAGSCVVRATFSKAGYDSKTADASGVTVVNGTMGTISWTNTYASGDLSVPNTRTLATAPTIDSPLGTTISYSSTTASVCSVDSGTGTITAVSAGSCVIRATFSKTGYTSKTADASGVTVVNGTMGTISWTGAYASGNLAVPNTRTLSSTPTIDSPSGTTISYSSTTASVCSVDSGTGTITAVSAGSCVVRATFSKTGYTSKTADATAVTVVNGTMGTISWTNTYASGDLSVPNTRTLAMAPTIDSPSGTTISYSSTTASVCSVDSGTGMITAVSAGSCVVRATFSKAGYADKSADAGGVTVVDGTMGTISWTNAYASGNLAVPNTRVLSSTPTIDSPSGTTISYSSTTASVCSVDSGTGTITAVSTGSCVVRATFSKTGYTSKTADANAVTVVNSTMGTITWTNAYASGNLAVPNTRVLSSTPTIDSPSGTTISYSSTTASVCSVDSGTGTITAVSAGSCVIRATFSKIGYTSKTADASGVTVVNGTMGTISWTNAYASGNLAVPNTRVLSSTPTIDSPSGTTISYSSTTASVCSVDSGTGTITAVSAGSCVVRATFSKTGYDSKTADASGVTVVNGTMGTITWNNAYASSNLTVPNTRSVFLPPTITAPSGTTISYSSTTAAVCSVDSSNGRITAVSAGSCVVRATFSKAGYDSKSADASGVTVVNGTMGTISWTNAYASGDLSFPNTRTLATAPTIDSPSDPTITYSSTTASICSVDSGTGTITAVSAGSCVIRATFSKTGYTSKTADASGVTVVNGAMGTITWTNAYASGDLTVPNTRTLSNAPTIDAPSDPTISYSSTTASVCSVDSGTGTITAVSAGSCVIRATFSKAGYDSKTADASGVTVVGQAMGTISWTNAYASGDLTVPNTRTLSNAPTIDAPSDPTISYSSTTASVCSVDSGTGTITAVSAGSCVIRATFSKAGYESKTDDASAVTVVNGAMGTISWTNAYASGDLTVPGTRNISTEPTIDSPLGTTRAYSSTTPSICSVESSLGIITAVSAGDCVAQVTFSKTGYDSKSASADAVTVVNGTMGTITWNTPYASGDLAVPNTRTLSNQPTITSPLNPTITYSSTTASICSVDSGTGTITAISPGSCVIRATFSRTGYDSKTEDAGAVTVVNGTMGTITWTNAYASGDLTVPNSRLLNNGPTIDTPSGTTISYSSTTPSICTVNNSGTATAVSAGSCVIQATFSKIGYDSTSANAGAITVVNP